MRTIGSLEEAGDFVVLQDAQGRVCQYVEDGDFEYLNEKGKLLRYQREGGWWDMRMENRVDPQRIEFPARVVWERAA
jgi:hypothetical protein